MTPLEDFKQKLIQFARGERRGIRNPFVTVPVEPRLEYRVGEHLATWARTRSNEPPITVIRLDDVFPRTDVFQVATSVSGETSDVTHEAIQETLEDNLGQELVEMIVNENAELMAQTEQVVLLLHLGSLYPFTRASELLDELDRLQVQATIGIPFPGRVIGGKLSFFGEDARHYYPAHRAGDDTQVREVHLQ